MPLHPGGQGRILCGQLDYTTWGTDGPQQLPLLGKGEGCGRAGSSGRATSACLCRAVWGPPAPHAVGTGFQTLADSLASAGAQCRKGQGQFSYVLKMQTARERESLQHMTTQGPDTGTGI